MKTNLKEKQEYEKIIDAKVASQILGISRSTVYKLVDKKLIDYIEVKTTTEFKIITLQDYIAFMRCFLR